jgi:hypothetical protein
MLESILFCDLCSCLCVDWKVVSLHYAGSARSCAVSMFMFISMSMSMSMSRDQATHLLLPSACLLFAPEHSTNLPSCA